MLRILLMRNIEEGRCLKSLINLLTLLFLFQNINQVLLFNYHYYLNVPAETLSPFKSYFTVWNLLLIQQIGMCLSSLSFISYLMKTKHFFTSIIAQVMYTSCSAVYMMFYLSFLLNLPKEQVIQGTEFQNKLIKNFILIIINMVGFMIIFISQKYYVRLFNIQPIGDQQVQHSYYNVTLMNYGLCESTKCDDKCDCSICFETKHQSLIGVLSCGHTFHSGCLIQWVKEKGEESNCPLCRNSLD